MARRGGGVCYHALVGFCLERCGGLQVWCAQWNRESPASVRDVCVRMGAGLLLSWERIAPILGGQRG